MSQYKSSDCVKVAFFENQEEAVKYNQGYAIPKTAYIATSDLEEGIRTFKSEYPKAIIKTVEYGNGNMIFVH